MKEFLTRFALIAGVLFLTSCGMFSQKQADQPVVEKKVEEKKTVAAAETSAPSSSHAPAPVSTHSEYRSGESTLYGDEPSVSPEVLPGDFRGGMRAPDLPNKLPMTLDGKINTSPSNSR